jgi:hypothetical protein
MVAQHAPGHDAGRTNFGCIGLWFATECSEDDGEFLFFGLRFAQQADVTAFGTASSGRYGY